MDEEDEIAHLLGGGYTGARISGNGPVPRRGENPAFDRLCDSVIDEEINGDVEASAEMRRALWATWKTDAPRGVHIPQRARVEEEDAELARAIMVSARESKINPRTGSRQQSPIVIPDDDDAELLRAIQMSEEEARAPKRQRRDSTPEEERRMLAEAMAASLAQTEATPIEAISDDDEEIARANEAFQASRAAFREEEQRRRQAMQTASSAVQSTKSETAKTSSITPRPMVSNQSVPAKQFPLSPAPRLPADGLLGDRAQMERDRLARQAARLGMQSAEAGPSVSKTTRADPSSAQVDRSKIATLSDYRPNTLSPTQSAFPGRTTVDKRSTQKVNPHHPLQSGPSGRDVAGEYFLDGELRHTSMTVGEPTSDPTFSPQQVIGDKEQISLIIMSSFVIDEPWLEDILPPADRVPRIVARPHPREHHPDWNGKVQLQENGEVRCYPQMIGDWGSAHMKYLFIFYKTGRLRIVISTANMVPYDWDWIENTIFVQDLLQKSIPPDTSLSDPPLPDFASQFRHLFLHLKVYKALKPLIEKHAQGGQIPITHNDRFASFAKWDWDRVKVQLVMSIPGTYSGGQDMEEYGMSRIGRVVSENGWKPKPGEVVKVEYQGSSLGAYPIDWFDTFYQYCCGKTTRALTGKPKATGFAPIKVVFPSLATVDASSLGRDGGGTMFCGKAFNAVTRHLFHDANSKRGGVLMHSKVLIALFSPRDNALGVSKVAKNGSSSINGKRKVDDIEDEDGGVGGWVYVGSHNFSSAAWGTVNLKKNPPTLVVRNYELGIMFPLPRNNAEEAADAVAPHKRPARRYGAEDIPWDQKLQQQNTPFT